jgi:hypothetical protein
MERTIGNLGEEIRQHSNHMQIYPNVAFYDHKQTHSISKITKHLPRFLAFLGC